MGSLFEELDALEAGCSGGKVSPRGRSVWSRVGVVP